MKSTGEPNFDILINNVKSSMVDFMLEYEPKYTQQDIDECTELLIEYVINIHKTTNKAQAMKVVKDTILNLNLLNDRCDGTLIETNEREQIAEIIILASHQMGYSSIDDDITEEWREW